MLAYHSFVTTLPALFATLEMALPDPRSRIEEHQAARSRNRTAVIHLGEFYAKLVLIEKTPILCSPFP